MTWLLLLLTTLFGILAWKNQNRSLYLLTATLPSYLLRTSILGVPTTLLELFLFVYVGTWLIRHKRLPTLPNKQVLIAIGLLFLAATLSIFTAPDSHAALGIWKAYFVGPMLFFFVVRHELARGAVHSKYLFRALGLSALLISLVAIAQWITKAGIPIPWDIERRVTSVFDYPNAVGLFLGPIIVLSTAHAYTHWSKFTGREKLFWLLTPTLSFLSIILSQSEAAVVSCVATLLIAAFTQKRLRLWAGGLALVLAIISLSTPALFQKLTLQDYSGGVRLSQWSETAELLKERWLLGAGLSGYPSALEPYHSATHFEIFQYPHNILLNTWVEIGLLGVIATALLGWHVLKRAPMTIPFFALLQMFIHGLVDVPYFKNDLSVLTWILLAMICAYAVQSNHQKTTS